MAGWFNNIWGDFGFRRNFLDDKQPYQQYEQIGRTEPIYIGVNNLDYIYETISHLKTVIDTNASMLSKLTWEIRDKAGKDGVKVENPSARELEVLALLKKPNALQSGEVFLNQLAISEDIHGNGYVNPLIGVRVPDALPLALWVLPNQFLHVKLTGKIYKQVDITGIIDEIYTEIGGVKENYEVKDVIRFKQPDAKPVIADSKIIALKTQLSNLQAAYESRNILIQERGANGLLSMQGGSRVDGVPIPLNAAEKDKAEKKLTNHYGMKRGQKRIAISPVPVTYTPMTFPVKDLMLFEEIEDDFNVILDAYGQNINIYSSGDAAKYENYKETLKGIYKTHVIPRAMRIAGVFTEALMIGDHVLYPAYDIDVLAENMAQKHKARKILVETVVRQIDAGLITISRGQEILGEKLVKISVPKNDN